MGPLWRSPLGCFRGTVLGSPPGSGVPPRGTTATRSLVGPRRCGVYALHGDGRPRVGFRGRRVTSPPPVSSRRRALRGELALRPLRQRRVQERGHVREPAHRRLPLRVPPRRVRAALLRGDHQELPAPVLRHLPRPETALPLHRLPRVSASRAPRGRAPGAAAAVSRGQRGGVRGPFGHKGRTSGRQQRGTGVGGWSLAGSLPSLFSSRSLADDAGVALAPRGGGHGARPAGPRVDSAWVRELGSRGQPPVASPVSRVQVLLYFCVRFCRSGVYLMCGRLCPCWGPVGWPPGGDVAPVPLEQTSAPCRLPFEDGLLSGGPAPPPPPPVRGRAPLLPAPRTTPRVLTRGGGGKAVSSASRT